MAPIKKLTTGHENYPKARTVSTRTQVARTHTNTVHSPTNTTSAQPRDTFERGSYDAGVEDMNRLRRQAQAQARSSQPASKTSVGRSTCEPSSSRAPQARAPRVKQGPPTVETGTVRNSGAPAAVECQPSPTRVNATIETAPSYPTARPKSGGLNKYEQAVFDAGSKKHNDYWNAEKAAKSAPAEAPPKRIASQEAAPAPKKAAPTTAVPSQASSTWSNVKTGAGGAVKVAAGGVAVVNGVEEMSKGHYLGGGLQVAQGMLYTADGANDLYTVGERLSGAAPSEFAAAGKIKAGGFAVSGAMAAHDAYSSWGAYKKGDMVGAAEHGASAVINAISAFPPTAMIGAAGGVLKFVMSASGADKMMRDAMNATELKAYEADKKMDLRVACRLAKMSTLRLSTFNRRQKQQFMRGLQGLKDFRAAFAAEGNQKGVAAVDAQIARIKGAWTQK